MTVAADVRAVCEACQATYHPRQHDQRFCSRECVNAARRVNAACRKPCTCQRDGCDAPPRSHGAKHCQLHADEDMRRRATEVAQRR